MWRRCCCCCRVLLAPTKRRRRRTKKVCTHTRCCCCFGIMPDVRVCVWWRWGPLRRRKVKTKCDRRGQRSPRMQTMGASLLMECLMRKKTATHTNNINSPGGGGGLAERTLNQAIRPSFYNSSETNGSHHLGRTCTVQRTSSTTSCLEGRRWMEAHHQYNVRTALDILHTHVGEPCLAWFLASSWRHCERTSMGQVIGDGQTEEEEGNRGPLGMERERETV